MTRRRQNYSVKDEEIEMFCHKKGSDEIPRLHDHIE